MEEQLASAAVDSKDSVNVRLSMIFSGMVGFRHGHAKLLRRVIELSNWKRFAISKSLKLK